MSNFNLDSLIRDNIRSLVPYASARSEYSGQDVIYLDANENSLGSAYNRYPDPLQQQLKTAIAAIKNVRKECIYLGNGSDEPIDLLIRSFCNPGRDNILVFPPTYGMYEVSAQINDVAVKKINLTADFQLDLPAALQAIDAHTKLIFICSPNNPTGNLIDAESIQQVLEQFTGLVVLDEAYIDFNAPYSFLQQLDKYPNLVILQTFSKAWGMAGLRLGMAFASPQIISVLNKVKAPYNINAAVQQLAAQMISGNTNVAQTTQQLVAARTALSAALQAFPFVKKVFPSDANFLLVRVDDAGRLYAYLKDKGIIVRNRSGIALCDNCLRITVGTAGENKSLITALNAYTYA